MGLEGVGEDIKCCLVMWETRGSVGEGLEEDWRGAGGGKYGEDGG